MSFSVALITLNASGTLAAVLEKVQGLADEIVVVDSGSSDGTVEIAESFGAKVFHEAWKGFGPQKNLAIDRCNSEWILLLDADEIPTESFIAALREVVMRRPAEFGAHPVFRITRRVECFGRKLHLTDRVPRLLAKGAARFDDRPVHESLVPVDSSQLRELPGGFVWHRTYDSLEAYFAKFGKYTSLGAVSLQEKGVPFRVQDAVARPIVRFFRLYFAKGLFRDGFVGFLYAALGAAYVLVKYAKLRELKNP